MEAIMQRWLFILTSVVILSVATALPVCADDHKPKDEHAAKAAHKDDGGLLKLRGDTAIWTLVVFGGLFLILYLKAWPSVLEGLKKREDTIRESLEEAKRTRAEMAQMQAQFQKDMAEAQQQIPRLMEEARKKAEEMSNDMRAKAAADVQTERERLRREIEIAKDQAIKQLWEQSAQLATLISAKAIGRSLSEDDHRRLIDEAMQEMVAQRGRNN
jgi:F-type H+-transporting ATPase subunit b